MHYVVHHVMHYVMHLPGAALELLLYGATGTYGPLSRRFARAHTGRLQQEHAAQHMQAVTRGRLARRRRTAARAATEPTATEPTATEHAATVHAATERAATCLQRCFRRDQADRHSHSHSHSRAGKRRERRPPVPRLAARCIQRRHRARQAARRELRRLSPADPLSSAAAAVAIQRAFRAHRTYILLGGR